jgi:hypothetical protein
MKYNIGIIGFDIYLLFFFSQFINYMENAKD